MSCQRPPSREPVDNAIVSEPYGSLSVPHRHAVSPTKLRRDCFLYNRSAARPRQGAATMTDKSTFARRARPDGLDLGIRLREDSGAALALALLRAAARCHADMATFESTSVSSPEIRPADDS